MSSLSRKPAQKPALLLGIALVFLSPAALAKETTYTAILSGLARVQKLQEMDNEKEYDLDARGVRMTGVPDDFLRHRTPAEILQSGLSCGCGDYAFAFYSLITSRGFEAIYIDAAALNYTAIERGDSGHTGVAVRDKESGNWVLVDPTNNKILSADWNPASPIYESIPGRFWIGYKGPLNKYPVKDHAALRKFYNDTLNTVPRAVWEKELLAFDYRVDDSLKRKDGSYSNPNMEAFLARPARILKTLGVHPSQTVTVTLKSWVRKTGNSDVVRNADGSWTCYVSEHSAMSVSLTDWIMAAIRRKSDLR